MAAFSDGKTNVQQGLAYVGADGSGSGCAAGDSASRSASFGCVRWNACHSGLGSAASFTSSAEVLVGALWLFLFVGVVVGLLCSARSCGVPRYMRLGASWLSPLLVLVFALQVKKSAFAITLTGMVFEFVLCAALMLGLVVALTLPPAVVSADVVPRGRAPACTVASHRRPFRQRTSAALQTTLARWGRLCWITSARVGAVVVAG